MCVKYIKVSLGSGRGKGRGVLIVVSTLLVSSAFASLTVTFPTFFNQCVRKESLADALKAPR